MATVKHGHECFTKIYGAIFCSFWNPAHWRVTSLTAFLIGWKETTMAFRCAKAVANMFIFTICTQQSQKCVL